MATWLIKNYHKKNAVERQFWSRDGVTVIKEEGFRWGSWTCDSDERPDLDLDNAHGYELMGTDLDWEMQDMDDGCWLEWHFPDDMPEQEQERIQAVWDSDWYEGMETDGWTNCETEHWIHGPIELTNMDTGHSEHGGHD